MAPTRLGAPCARVGAHGGGVPVPWNRLRRPRPLVAALVTTIVFVLGHGVSLHPYWPAILAIASLGIAALAARIVTRSLAPCISMHAAYNLGMVMAVYAGLP